MSVGSFDRQQNLAALADGDFDVLVIGGGITGCGVALDAASRGLRTALVEARDFASGTSSKSSKLVHGGLRYLQNGDIRLVYEALHERQRLRHNAPHLVKILPFLIPLFSKDGLINPKVARALGSAMWLYDLTGGARIGKLHKRLKPDAAVERMPTLPRERLAGAYLYYDAQADDARLTLTLARTAALDFGAVVVNRAPVVELLRDGDRVTGAIVDAEVSPGHQRIEIRARVVVNAAGVWSDDVRALDEATHPDSIRPAKGIHLTVPWDKVRNEIAVVIPVPKDRRSVFVVPWMRKPDGSFAFTYVGTTDTDYEGPIDDPQCTSDDVEYLLSAINRSVREPLDPSDVLGTWAGLRPLVKDATSDRTADLSRRHRVTASASGVITVTGGKLTTYREMAEDTVDALVERLDAAPRRARRCRTKKLELRGAAGYASDPGADTAAGLDAEQTRHLADRYGGEARVVYAMCETDPSLAQPLVPGLPYLRAEALYAARYEMAVHLDDVLARRTRSLLLQRDAAADAAADIAALVGPELGWTAADEAAEAQRFRDLAEHERTSPGLPPTDLHLAAQRDRAEPSAAG
jgi:glycerol-3-phosphate dehydrogenase